MRLIRRLLKIALVISILSTIFEITTLFVFPIPIKYGFSMVVADYIDLLITAAILGSGNTKGFLWKFGIFFAALIPLSEIIWVTSDHVTIKDILTPPLNEGFVFGNFTLEKYFTLVVIIPIAIFIITKKWGPRFLQYSKMKMLWLRNYFKQGS